jgi:hypothetical protein
MPALMPDGDKMKEAILPLERAAKLAAETARQSPGACGSRKKLL